MAEEFKDIKMIGLVKSECIPVDGNKAKFTEVIDKFTFVIKLSQEAPKNWIDIFNKEVPHDKILKTLTVVSGDKLIVKNVTFSLFKIFCEKYEESIKIANSEYRGFLKQESSKNAIIQKKLDDLELELFKTRPVKSRAILA